MANIQQSIRTRTLSNNNWFVAWALCFQRELYGLSNTGAMITESSGWICPSNGQGWFDMEKTYLPVLLWSQRPQHRFHDRTVLWRSWLCFACSNSLGATRNPWEGQRSPQNPIQPCAEFLFRNFEFQKMKFFFWFWCVPQNPVAQRSQKIVSAGFSMLSEYYQINFFWKFQNSGSFMISKKLVRVHKTAW